MATISCSHSCIYSSNRVSEKRFVRRIKNHRVHRVCARFRFQLLIFFNSSDGKAQQRAGLRPHNWYQSQLQAVEERSGDRVGIQHAATTINHAATTLPRGSTPPGGSGGGSNALVIHCVTKEISSSESFPTLTRSNYYDWAACMRVMLQARGLWIAVSIGTNDLTEDRMALEVVTKAVPAELMGTIANKATAKIAWDSLKLMNVGVERVRKAKASTLRREFDSLKFKDGETVDDFGIRINRIANQLAVLGGGLQEEEIIASSIETLLDLGDVTVEELIGRLKATEERHGYNGNDTIAKLNLTEDELVARISSWLQLTGRGSGSSSSGGSSGGSGNTGSKRGKEPASGNKKGRGHGGGRSGHDGGTVAGNECRYCGKKGHWARECRKKKRDKQAHVAQTKGGEGEQALLVATTMIATTTSSEAARSTSSLPSIHLDESKLYLGDKGGGGHTEWILDTGATNNLTGVRSAFSELDTGIHGTVRFGDGSVAGIEGRGTILFKCKNGEHQALGGIYHIPCLTANVISLGQMEEAGFKILLDKGCLKIWDQRRRLLAKVPRGANRLYVLKLDIAKPVGLRRLTQEEMVRGLPQIEHVDQVCDNCLAGKQWRLAFPATEAKYRVAHKLELVHGDLCNPVTPMTPSGNKLFFLLVDDLSRYMWLILLSTKDQAFTVFTAFQARAEAEAGRKLGTLRTDRGGEFTARTFIEHCAQEGIQRHFTAPHTPQQNGVVERRNQTVMGTARSMMKAMSMPGWFWGEAVTTAVFILNRSPTQSVDGKTLFEVWHGVKPPVHFLRTFGCVAHVKAGGKHLTKLGGSKHANGTKAWRFYNPVTRRVHVARDAVFEESRPWDWGDDKGAGPGDEDEPFCIEFVTVGGVRHDAGARAATGAPPATSTPPSPATTPTSAAMPTCGPEPRTPAAPTPAGPSMVQFATPPTGELDLDEDHEDDAPLRFQTMDNVLGLGSPPGLADRELTQELLVAIGNEPASVEEAKTSKEWRMAMLEEMASIEENKTWSLVDLPRGHRAIGLKWVFKLKHDEHGEIVKHKARLVAKGYVQRQGIDFEEVFTPVARMESVHVVLAVVAHCSWSVHHMDVKSAFLNGDELAEEVYVTQPPGFTTAGHEEKVLRLHKALYGLCQAPRAWNAKLDASLHELGFTNSKCEHGLYMRGAAASRLLVGVYVDDHGLFYTNDGGKLDLLGYSNSDMASDVDGRKSTTGVIFFLGGNPVTWLSQKQRVVALSSCEAKFIAGASAACQAVWLRRLLEDVTGARVPTPVLKMDNQSAIALSKNPVLHDRSKHIDTKFHFIRECAEKGDINIEFTGTQEQLADILTKPLGRKAFQSFAEELGLSS
ncbi:LOW QUALITY PROTEIN: hypothetical protein U9M48_035165 [Paspalum notatum var. saurae]|uniref:Polyprotein n=1 Tax=Paspalum notatum var. saurae TaxID=547442 RepID=A0AAQ3UCK1_PASNO